MLDKQNQVHYISKVDMGEWAYSSGGSVRFQSGLNHNRVPLCSVYLHCLLISYYSGAILLLQILCTLQTHDKDCVVRRGREQYRTRPLIYIHWCRYKRARGRKEGRNLLILSSYKIIILFHF